MKIEELYRTVIMDHYKNPHNKGLIEGDGYQLVHLHNPSCGDDIKIVIKVENNTIIDVRQDGTGCSICCSSASVMTDTLIGKSIKEAKELINEFYSIVTGVEIDDKLIEDLGEAVAYSGVSKFPARVKCATLAWKACEQALKDVESNE